MLVHSWHQKTGQLVVTGDVRVCRVWDAHAERVMHDVNIAIAHRPVVALAADCENRTFALGARIQSGFIRKLDGSGNADGCVHLYDVRVSDSPRVLTLRELRSTPVAVHFLQDGSPQALVVAGSVDGRVCVWDPRMYTVRGGLFILGI